MFLHKYVNACVSIIVKLHKNLPFRHARLMQKILIFFRHQAVFFLFFLAQLLFNGIAQLFVIVQVQFETFALQLFLFLLLLFLAVPFRFLVFLLLLLFVVTLRFFPLGALFQEFPYLKMFLSLFLSLVKVVIYLDFVIRVVFGLQQERLNF